LSKTGFTHSDLLCWQIDYAGGSLNVNGTIMRDTYTSPCQLLSFTGKSRSPSVKFIQKRQAI
ncbi:hypothetical protein, partial [Salmonella enterica]|uniref:hypothetical protein n=1 Tax=Salmonella enterica TaxID=28901 RepID=UPI0031BAECAC